MVLTRRPAPSECASVSDIGQVRDDEIRANSFAVLARPIPWTRTASSDSGSSNSSSRASACSWLHAGYSFKNSLLCTGVQACALPFKKRPDPISCIPVN
jgi:hypothetical protein